MDRDLFFVNEVNEVNINRLIQDIQKLRGSTEAIRLFISSPGGTGRLGVCFYEWIKSEKINLTTIALGFVASAAIYIFLSGTTRKATIHSTFLIHRGGFPTDKAKRGIMRLLSSQHYKEDTDVDSSFATDRASIIKQETAIGFDEALSCLTRTHLIMDSTRAKEKGFISEII